MPHNITEEVVIMAKAAPKPQTETVTETVEVEAPVSKELVLVETEFDENVLNRIVLEDGYELTKEDGESLMASLRSGRARAVAIGTPTKAYYDLSKEKDTDVVQLSPTKSGNQTMLMGRSHFHTAGVRGEKGQNDFDPYWLMKVIFQGDLTSAALYIIGCFGGPLRQRLNKEAMTQQDTIMLACYSSLKGVLRRGHKIDEQDNSSTQAKRVFFGDEVAIRCGGSYSNGSSSNKVSVSDMQRKRQQQVV